MRIGAVRDAAGAVWAREDPRPLAFLRIGVGVAAIINAVELWSQAVAVVERDGIRMPQWSWLPALTQTGAQVALLAGVVLGAMLALGILSRPAALLVAVLALGAPLVEQQLYSNHLTLLACMAGWLAFARCDTAWAMRPPASGRAPVRLRDELPLMTQISVVYLATGLVKLNERFLSGDVIAGSMRWDLPAEWLPVLAWMAALTELALAVGLWVPRVRWLVAAAGVGLHLSIPVLMTVTARLVPFSLLMLAAYPLFLWRGPVLRRETDDRAEVRA